MLDLDLIKIILLALSALAAIYAIHRNTLISRRRATVDLILHQRSDEELKAANNIINPLFTDNSIMKYSSADEKESDERKAILTVLNNHEFIASGIRERAFDFKLYRRMKHGTVLRDWREFRAFIIQMRKDNKHQTLYQGFEWLAEKFKSKPLPLNNKNQ